MKPSSSTPNREGSSASRSERQGTHYEGCWRDPRHHGCAVAYIEHLTAVRSELRTLKMVRDDLEAWPPAQENQRQFVMPEDLIRLVQTTLEYYAAFDTWHGERTGGVLEGCPRGAPDIHRDGGKFAGQALLRLIRSYPLRQSGER